MVTYGDPEFCPRYCDPLFVPKCWYPEGLLCCQIVAGSRGMGYPKDYEPVVMRGGQHCRLWKYGSYRYLGTAVLRRYLQKHHVTEYRPHKWFNFVHYTVAPQARKQYWYYRQRNTLDDILGMVDGEMMVVIDGHPVFCQGPEEYSLVVKLIEALWKLDRQASGKVRRGGRPPKLIGAGMV